MTSSFTLGYSTCPNDTFIFDAMVHHKIDTEGLEFKPLLEDVEKLNHRAFLEELDITKLSYHAYFYLQDKYKLLSCGSALGNNCGPLVISKNKVDPHTLHPSEIGIPGRYTTANFLLQLYMGKKLEAKEYLFSDIESALLRDEIKAGVIIHETRFTYASKGLQKIQDLGEFWEGRTQMPIPLGGIVVRKDLGQKFQEKIERILKRSVQFALDHPESSRNYVTEHAQEMSDEVMRRHIELYVNSYTLELGNTGRAAVDRMLNEAQRLPE
jgi:1,4-dihydroxy-6-naphthoate synthase